MDKEAAYELLVYMVTSAAGLAGEPKYYGELRMIEASQRFAQLMLRENPEDACLSELIRLIDANKNKSMTDPAAFNRMLQEAAAVLVDGIN